MFFLANLLASSDDRKHTMKETKPSAAVTETSKQRVCTSCMLEVDSNFRMHACTHAHTHKQPFMALLDFVRDYPGEPAPER